MDSNSVTRDWTTLPKQILIKIAKCLRTPLGILRFRAVCSSFRSLLPLPPKVLSPYPTFKLALGYRGNQFGCSLLSESTIYAIQPLHKISNTHQTTNTWLVRLEESKPGQVQLLDPLRGFPFKTLSGRLPVSLNLLDYHVQEVTKVHKYGLAAIGGMIGVARVCNESERGVPVQYRKIVSSKCLNEIDGDDGYTLMALVTGGQVCVRRNRDEQWTFIDLRDDESIFEDVLHHNGKFYALGSLGVTLSLDSKSFDFKLAAAPLQIEGGSAMYLVKSVDDLYMLVKCYFDAEYQENLDDEYNSIHWNVFKLDEGKHQWVPVKNGLEDRVFFVGDDCTFCVSAKDFSGCKGGCVYFNENVFSKARTDYPGSGVAIFDMENDIAGPFSAFPRYSQIFWPPPTWLLRLEFLLNREIGFLDLSDLLMLLWQIILILNSIMRSLKEHFCFEVKT